MRLEMLVEMLVEILDVQSSCLFSNESFEKRPVMTIEDFVLHSDDHFESHLLALTQQISGPFLSFPSKTCRTIWAICVNVTNVLSQVCVVN